MENIWDEGIRMDNGFPLPVECLVMQELKGQRMWTDMHYHKYIEILYTLTGDYEVRLNGDIFAMPERSMFVINAGEPHSTKVIGKGDHVLMCIKFMPQVLYSSTQTVSELKYSLPYVFERFGNRRLFESEILANTHVPETFDYILEEHKQAEFGYELAIRSGVLRIFSVILRYWHNSTDNSGAFLLKDDEARMLQNVRMYVEQNYADATLTSVAEACGLSYSYFSRIFNRYMKMSFSDYVNLVRVNHSLNLLSSGDQSITEIALSVGFSSTSYYIYIFKKLKHTSPNKFRKMFLNHT